MSDNPLEKMSTNELTGNGRINEPWMVEIRRRLEQKECAQLHDQHIEFEYMAQIARLLGMADNDWDAVLMTLTIKLDRLAECKAALGTLGTKMDEFFAGPLLSGHFPDCPHHDYRACECGRNAARAALEGK